MVEDKKALIESIPALKNAADKFYGKKEVGITAGRIPDNFYAKQIDQIFEKATANTSISSSSNAKRLMEVRKQSQTRFSSQAEESKITSIYDKVRAESDEDQDEEKDHVGELGDEHSEIRKAMIRPVSDAETDNRIDGYYEMTAEEKLEALLDRTEDLF